MLKTQIGILIDIYNDNGLYATIRNESGIKKDYVIDFQPYFYILFDEQLNEQEIIDLGKILENPIEIIKTKKNNSSKFIYKLIFKNVESLVISKEHLISNDSLKKVFSLREYDIHFISRFFINN
jgi:DNA polymerase elongation subunit (family B)